MILHELRRTAATGMAKLNVAPHVVDKILDHSSGTVRGVAAVYNRFAYAQERRVALVAWGENLTLVTRVPSQDDLNLDALGVGWERLLRCSGGERESIIFRPEGPRPQET